mmetsp:Transcript_14403/g.37076  ORF Transcript_14403/g.37076 Transcript_14403/m.37076 type:complete len:200 (+) Transcript_14403:364-963(+)
MPRQRARCATAPILSRASRMVSSSALETTNSRASAEPNVALSSANAALPEPTVSRSAASISSSAPRNAAATRSAPRKSHVSWLCAASAFALMVLSRPVNVVKVCSCAAAARTVGNPMIMSLKSEKIGTWSALSRRATCGDMYRIMTPSRMIVPMATGANLGTTHDVTITITVPYPVAYPASSTTPLTDAVENCSASRAK